MPTTTKRHKTSTTRLRKGKRDVVLISLFILLTCFSLPVQNAHAQSRGGQQQFSQQFRLGEGLIRIAEPGQLADTVNVWGDVGVTGRYIVPRGTNIADVISYARGPIRTGGNESDLDRARFRIDLIVSRIHESQDLRNAYSYRYEEALPTELRTFTLQNGDLVFLQVRRRPTFRDYMALITPTLSLTLTAILLYDRVTQ
jgi:hypothetical protein